MKTLPGMIIDTMIKPDTIGLIINTIWHYIYINIYILIYIYIFIYIIYIYIQWLHGWWHHVCPRAPSVEELRVLQRRIAEVSGWTRGAFGLVYGCWLDGIIVEILFWVNYNDLTATSLGMMVSKGNHPQMAKHFRLVKYYNLPRLLGHNG